jgi:hypothetical protein
VFAISLLNYPRIIACLRRQKMYFLAETFKFCLNIIKDNITHILVLFVKIYKCKRLSDVHTYVHMYVHMYVHICMYIYECTYMYVHMYVCMYVCSFQICFFCHKNENLNSNLMPQCASCVGSRAARFFLVHDTKTWKNVPNEYKMYQMVIKYRKWL